MRGALIGLVAFGAAVAFMAVPRLIGNIWPTQSVQTGFRGTGMDQTSRLAAVEALAAANVLPASLSTPIPPVPGEPLAGDVYPNAAPLEHLTARNFERLVAAMRIWTGNETPVRPRGQLRHRRSRAA